MFYGTLYYVWAQTISGLSGGVAAEIFDCGGNRHYGVGACATVNLLQ